MHTFHLKHLIFSNFSNGMAHANEYALAKTVQTEKKTEPHIIWKDEEEGRKYEICMLCARTG